MFQRTGMCYIWYHSFLKGSPMWLLGLVFNRRRITFRMFTQCIRSPVDVPRFKVFKLFYSHNRVQKVCFYNIFRRNYRESFLGWNQNTLTADMYHKVVCFYFFQDFFLNDVLIWKTVFMKMQYLCFIFLFQKGNKNYY